MLRCRHTGQRQKCSTTIPVLFQIFNHLTGGILIVRYNILDTSAQCCLNGGLIRFFHFDQICDNTVNSRCICLTLHDPADAVAISVIALRDITQRFQTGTVLVILLLALIHPATQFFKLLLPVSPLLFNGSLFFLHGHNLFLQFCQFFFLFEQ